MLISRCVDCQNEYYSVPNDGKCPICGGENWTPMEVGNQYIAHMPSDWQAYPVCSELSIRILKDINAISEENRNLLQKNKEKYRMNMKQNEQLCDREKSSALGEEEREKREILAKRNESIELVNRKFEELLTELNTRKTRREGMLSRKERRSDSILNAGRSFYVTLSQETRQEISDSMMTLQDLNKSLTNVAENSHMILDGCHTSMCMKAESMKNQLLEKLDHLSAQKTEQIEEGTRKAIQNAENLKKRRDEAATREYCGTSLDGMKKQFDTIYNKDTFASFEKTIRQYHVDGMNFRLPEGIPPFVEVGRVAMDIPVPSDDPACHTVSDMIIDYIGTNENNHLHIDLPYAQSVKEGISLVLRKADSKESHAILADLLLKLFVSFPAGKLEAILIDPLKMGSAFTNILKLGDGAHTERFINQKVWYDNKDIEKVLLNLAERIPSINTNRQSSSANKEPSRVLVINDYPNSFSRAALNALQQIVSNHILCGFFLLITVDETALSQDPVAENILSSLHQAFYSSGRFVVENNAEGIYLDLKQTGEVFQNQDMAISSIRDQILHAPVVVEEFVNMFPGRDLADCNDWFQGNSDEIEIPIGISSAGNVQKMILGQMGSTAHHALITGQTGAGKSTLLHTIIMSTLVNYSPGQVQMYLLDFKQGVEFNCYARYRLPSMRVVAVNSQRDFGLNVLKELAKELENRAALFKLKRVDNLAAYRALPEVIDPPARLLLIFDEVQELFRSALQNDPISHECISCIKLLVEQGRAMGIHVILASQDFRQCDALKEKCFHNMSVRIQLRGSTDQNASILSETNRGLALLQNQPAGSAIYNSTEGDGNNDLFQISCIRQDEREALLSQMDEYYNLPELAPMYADMTTRVMLTDISEEHYNCFNQLIRKGADHTVCLSPTEDSYGIFMGQGYKLSSSFIPEFEAENNENMLMALPEAREKEAMAMFIMSALSVMYEDAHRNGQEALIYIVDFSRKDLTIKEECNLESLSHLFSERIFVARGRDARSMVVDLYTMVNRRNKKELPSNQRVFFLLFGVQRTSKLSALDNPDEESFLDMISGILTMGPKNGVNSIVWGGEYGQVTSFIGRSVNVCNHRIAMGISDEQIRAFIGESVFGAEADSTAIYSDFDDFESTSIRFRPYEVPSFVWVESFSQAISDEKDNKDSDSRLVS